MGYIGLVPGSLWIWNPTQVELSDQWRTLISEFETGVEQRRSKWTKPRATVRFRFDRGTLTPDDITDIWRFYQKQQGSFRTFDLPIYGRITTITSEYTGGFALGLSDTIDMTSDSGSRWNALYVENAALDRDLFRITSVVNTTHVEVQSAGANSYVVGDPVSPVIKARFADDVLSPTYLVALLTVTGIEFTEVRS